MKRILLLTTLLALPLWALAAQVQISTGGSYTYTDSDAIADGIQICTSDAVTITLRDITTTTTQSYFINSNGQENANVTIVLEGENTITSKTSFIYAYTGSTFKITGTGTADITTTNTFSGYGLYAYGSEIEFAMDDDTGSMTITPAGSSACAVYVMRDGAKFTMTSGTLNINVPGSSASGIHINGSYGNNSMVINDGTINISATGPDAYGIEVKGSRTSTDSDGNTTCTAGSLTINSGTVNIIVTGGGYGIYSYNNAGNNSIVVTICEDADVVIDTASTESVYTSDNINYSGDEYVTRTGYDAPTATTETITAGSKYNVMTYVLANDLDFSEVEGVAAYIPTSYSDGALTMEEVTGECPKLTGVYLVFDEVSTSVDVPVCTLSNDAESYPSSLLIGSTDSSCVVGPDADTSDYNNPDDYDYYVLQFLTGDSAPTFHIVQSAITVPATKAFLRLTKSSANASTLRIDFGDEETTSIAQSLPPNAQRQLYNLAGQRVSVANKGLYIINGKKVVK